MKARPLLFALALLPLAAVAQTPSREARIEALLRLTTGDLQIDRLPGLYLQHLEQMRAQIPPETYPRLEQAVRNATEPKRLLEPAVQQMAASFDADAADDIEAFYATPLGQRVTRAEAHAASPAGMTQLRNYLATARAVPPPAAREILAERFDRATRTSEGSVHAQLTARRALVAAVGRLRGEPPSAEMLDQDAAEARAAIAPQIQKDTLAVVLFVMSPLSTPELQQYAEFVESPAGAWFYSNLRVAVERAQSEVARALNAQLAAN